MKYKKRPVVIEALQFYPESLAEVCKFVGKSIVVASTLPHITIVTLEGNMKAMPGDWIIKGVNGEFYPCKPDIFEKTYEKVEE